MSDEIQPNPQNDPRAKFSFAILLRALMPALAATAIVVFLFARSTSHIAKATRARGGTSVTLSQKDSAFQPIPRSRGGASADVHFANSGTAFHFLLRAEALPPGRQYVLEIEVDSTTYAVTSRAPNAQGELTIDTTLATFAEGVCVGANFDAPRPVAGHHTIKFRVKRDGSPVSGVMPGIERSAPGASIACHGNGDGNYDYALLENEDADFTGTGRADSH